MKLFVVLTLTIVAGAVLSGCTAANRADSNSAPNAGAVNAVATSNGSYPGQVVPGAPKSASGVNQTAPPNQANPGSAAPAAAGSNSVQVETVIGSGVVVDAPKLAKLSIQDVDKKFGAARSQQNLGSGGAKRIYSVGNGKAELEVSVQPDGKINEFALKLNEPRRSSDDLLRAVGLDPKGHKPNWETEIVKKYENQDFGGTRFKQVSASMNPAEQLWNRIELEIAN